MVDSRSRLSGIHLPVTPPEEVGLDSVAGLHSEYDIQGQRLLLDVPPDWEELDRRIIESWL